MKTLRDITFDYIHVYCDLTAEDESQAQHELLAELGSFARSLRNEGHDGDALVTYAMVEEDRLPALAAHIRAIHGGGDDIVYLYSGGEACNFRVVRHPGLTAGYPLVDMDELADMYDTDDTDERANC